MQVDTLVSGGTVISPDFGRRRLDIGIQDGRIVGLYEPGARVEAGQTIEARGLYVLPGVVEPHIHIGHGAEHARDFDTETASAVVGGVTTILNFFRKHPYNYHESLPRLIEAGEQNARVDFALHLVLFTEDNLEQIPSYIEDFGITSFKFFSGIGTTDHVNVRPQIGPIQPIDDGFLLAAFRKLAAYDGIMTLVHCENAEINARAKAEVQRQGREDLVAWCDSRPAVGEAQHVNHALFFAQAAGVPLYLVHLSSQVAVEAARPARAAGWPVYLESCPQFLTHTRESDVGVVGKMSPPFRTAEDTAYLWQRVADGTIDTIGSDHGAFTRAEKQGVWTGASGFPGVATILPVMLSEGVRTGRITLERAVEVTSANPARLFGLYPQKGCIAVGSDADLALVDLDLERVVSHTDLASRSDFSIYDGWTLTGWPVLTMVRGQVVMRDGQVVGEKGNGRYLRRTARRRDR
jgi:dihydropyrimidinase